MNEDDREIEQSLRRGLKALRAGRGECPAAEILARFADQSLTVEQHALVQEHVDRCGRCDAALLRLQEFESPSNLPADADWPDRERRIRARVFSEPRWRRVLASHGLGYALAGIFAALLLMAKLQQPSGSPRPSAWQSVAVLDLNVVRDGSRSLTAPSDKPVVLSFFVAIRADRLYSMSLDGGQPERIQSYDGRGAFRILYYPQDTEAGTHRLLVHEIEPSTGNVNNSFEFSFTTK